MSEQSDIRAIIELWPNSAELARRLGLDPVVVQRWKTRNRIPGEYDFDLVKLARSDGLDLTFEMLALARSPSDQIGTRRSRKKGVTKKCGQRPGKGAASDVAAE